MPDDVPHTPSPGTVRAPGRTLSRRHALQVGGAAALGATALPTTASATPHAREPSRVRGLQLVPRPRADGGHEIVVRDGSGTELAAVLDPLQVLVKIGDGPVAHVAGYTRIVGRGGHLTATGAIDTPAGSRYQFTDRYRVHGDGVRVSRNVRVAAAGDLQEVGFNSRLAVAPASGGPLHSYDRYLPGVRWGDAQGLIPGSLGTSEGTCYAREQRLTLPFVALRDQEGGRSVSLSHVDARPRTNRDGFVVEPSGQWWINADIDYCALGVHGDPRAEVVLVHPALEGELPDDPPAAWLRRSHPVREGFEHDYVVEIGFVPPQEGFPAAAALLWRRHWDRWRTRAIDVTPDVVLDSGISLLSDLVEDYNGYPGLPFRTRLPTGEPDAISYVMGFIGQQAPAGYQLLRAGLSRGDDALVAQGSGIVDFWVEEAPLPNGQPRLWSDGDGLRWREGYPGFVRVASDGMEGVLDAARLMRRRAEPVARWEQMVVDFGDFLVERQGADGSFPRAWNWDGSVASPEVTNTSHPIRFLVGLGVLSEDDRYTAAAIRAGEFYRDLVGGSFDFLGGTADNANVLDKEAGALALRAFLAVHDATGDESWLAEARRAADFTESWLFSWPYEIDTPRAAYRDQGALGLSLIAGGARGVDTWLTYSGADYYRLYLWTGDRHYLQVAQDLTSHAYRTTQLPGNDLGYDRDGIVEEAITLSDLVYDGVGTWLPWCTVAQLEPLSVLEDRFGSMDLRRIERRPWRERRELNRRAGLEV